MEDERGHRILRDDLYCQLSDSQRKLYMDIREWASRLFTRNDELLEVIQFLLAEMDADRIMFDNQEGHYNYLRADIEKYEPLEPR